MFQSETNKDDALDKQELPRAIVVSSEPVVQCETWVRARLIEMLLRDTDGPSPNLAPKLDQYLDLLTRIATVRDEPLADCLYAGVWAIGLARAEGIQVDHIFANRVRALVDLILAETPKGPGVEPQQTKRSAIRQHRTRNRTKKENLNKG